MANKRIGTERNGEDGQQPTRTVKPVPSKCKDCAHIRVEHPREGPCNHYSESPHLGGRIKCSCPGWTGPLNVYGRTYNQPLVDEKGIGWPPL